MIRGTVQKLPHTVAGEQHTRKTLQQRSPAVLLPLELTLTPLIAAYPRSYAMGVAVLATPEPRPPADPKRVFRGLYSLPRPAAREHAAESCEPPVSGRARLLQSRAFAASRCPQARQQWTLQVLVQRPRLGGDVQR